jgi:hypothetical protein
MRSTAAAWQLADVMAPLAALRESAGVARAHVRVVLRNWRLQHLEDDALTVASELIANAINASTDPATGEPRLKDGRLPVVTLCLLADSTTLRIEAWDESDGVPVIQQVADREESGRGLDMVAKLTTTWGWEANANAKCVWAEMAI